MAWYRTGTVTVTNGSPTVTGSGTAFIANATIGEGFLGPDGRTYEITDIPSNTSLTISPAYLGSTAGGQSYAILPARGRIADLIAETSSLLSSFSAVRDGIGAGLFPDGSAAAPAFRFSGDQDTGFYRVGSNVLGIATGGIGRAFFDGNGRFGVGTSSPATNIEVVGTDPNVRIRQLTSNATPYGIEIGGGGEVDASFKSVLTTGEVRLSAGRNSSWGGFLTVLTDTVERMRITATGNVGIGTASPTERLTVLGDAQTAGFFRNINVASVGSAGNLIVLGSLNGTTPTAAGAIGAVLSGDAATGRLQFYTRSGGALVERANIDTNGTMYAAVDNTQNLGSGSFRWSTVFAGTGTINTSDEREKHWRGELNAAELRAAKRIIGELGIYQWNDAVEEKGEDGARLHFGVRAQRAFAIMDDEGLDWGRYAWACYDEWDEQTEPVFEEVTVTKTRKVSRPSTLIDPATGQPAMVEVDEAYEETEMQPTGETRVTLEAGDRYGVRPDQLAFWLIAAQAAMQSDLEARLAALEAA